MQKIVFNAHYLMYFDTAVAQYWRCLAMPYAAAMQQMQGDVFVRHASLEYFAAARYDDLLQVGIKCARVGKSSMQFVGGIFRQEQLLVSATLVYVFADPQATAARPVPDVLRRLYMGFEAGECVTRLALGSWAELGKAATSVRFEVFVHEQKVPQSLELDQADESATHAVLFNLLDMPVAAARLLQPEPKVAQIGRMAVLQPLRGEGFGAVVLNALLDAARARGDKQVILHAQKSAAGFYTRAGFVAQGAGFEEAGIAHITMGKLL